MSKLTLSSREKIVAAVPEKPIGPGWSNQLVWVYIARGGDIRRECVQYADFTPAMATLFKAGVEMCKALREAVTDSNHTLDTAQAIRNAGMDISPCCLCGALVVCIPDGLPVCKACGEKEEAEG